MKRGFTLIEVLVAMLIFALSVFAISRTRTTALRNVIDSRSTFEAASLAELKMTELEFKLQKQIDNDGVDSVVGSSESGTFEAPFAKYSWKLQARESSVKFTKASMSAFLGSMGVEKEDVDEQVEAQRLVLSNLNRMLKNNFVELYLTIEWKDYGKSYTLPLITHIVPGNPKIELSTEEDD